ncbi:MAG: DUF58 domain-containing protein [Planctomycetota bacterium]
MASPSFQTSARAKAKAFVSGRRAPDPSARSASARVREPANLADHSALLASNRELGWRSNILVEGFRQGIHHSRLHGFSSEFAQYKNYTPNDDLRHLDWHVLGRLDRLCIRQHEAETNLRAHLIVDASASMAYQSEGSPRSKADHAALLSAAFTRLLTGQNDACGLTVLTPDATSGPQHIEPALGRLHVDRVLAMLEKSLTQSAQPTPPNAETVPPDTIAPALDALAASLSRRGLIAVFTDGFEDIEPLFESLRLLRVGRHDLVLVQVVDPQEIAFEFEGRKRFRDLETGTRLPVSPSLVRKRYLDALKTHQDHLESSCAVLAVHHVLAVTNESPFQTLYQLARARGPHTAARRAGAGGVR